MKPEYNINRVADRLNSALKRKGITQAELADITGINFSTISSYVSGRFEPKRTPLLEMAKALDVSPAWLAGFDVDMEREPNKVFKLSPDSATITIPFINQKLSAGTGADYLSAEDTTVRTISVLSTIARGANIESLVAAEVVGDSMIGEKIFSGDIVIFSRGLIRGSGIYVINYAGEVMVKKVTFDALENKVTIISANIDYPPKTVDADCIAILGKVLGWIHMENY